MNRYLKPSLLAILAALTMLSLWGCGRSAAPAPTAAPTSAPAAAPAAADGLSFSTAGLSADAPTFWDAQWNGVPLQVMALSDGKGGVLLAYNTCPICAGSPYAYFEVQEGTLVCQNCGNAFPFSAIGESSGGCDPMPVEEYRLENDRVILEAAELDRAAQAFAHWKEGLTE